MLLVELQLASLAIHQVVVVLVQQVSISIQKVQSYVTIFLL